MNAHDDRSGNEIAATDAPFEPLPWRRVVGGTCAFFARRLVTAIAITIIAIAVVWTLKFAFTGTNIHITSSVLRIIIVVGAIPTLVTLISIYTKARRSRAQHVPYRTMYEALAVFSMEDGHPAFRQLSRAQIEEQIMTARAYVARRATATDTDT